MARGEGKITASELHHSVTHEWDEIAVSLESHRIALESIKANGTKIATGSYSGSGSSGSRFISVGFTPKLVIVAGRYKSGVSGVDMAIITSTYSGFYFNSDTSIPKTELYITENGFRVGGNNAPINGGSPFTYDWVAIE